MKIEGVPLHDPVPAKVKAITKDPKNIQVTHSLGNTDLED